MEITQLTTLHPILLGVNIHFDIDLLKAMGLLVEQSVGNFLDQVLDT